MEAEGYEYRRLDGKTPTENRVQIVDEFNSDPNVFIFLISTRLVYRHLRVLLAFLTLNAPGPVVWA